MNKAKHRIPYSRWFKYPIPIYIHEFKNRWYFFTKPKLKAKLKSLIGGK